MANLPVISGNLTSKDAKLLPFMKKKAQIGVIVQTRPADEAETEQHEEPQSGEIDELEGKSEELCNALEAKNYRRVAEITKEMHEIMHSYMDKE